MWKSYPAIRRPGRFFLFPLTVRDCVGGYCLGQLVNRREEALYSLVRPCVAVVPSAPRTRPVLSPAPLPSHTMNGAVSAAKPPPSLPPSPPLWRPPEPPRGGGGGAGHGTSRVGRRAVRYRQFRRFWRVLLLCDTCLTSAFWGCMLRGAHCASRALCRAGGGGAKECDGLIAEI